jgi:hypothetical protein
MGASDIVFGRLLTRCEHGGVFSHTYLADPDGYAVEVR